MKYIKKDVNFKFDVTYEIISKFDKVINLKFENKIYSIFKKEISEAPYSLIVDDEMFEYLHSFKENVFIEKKEALTFYCNIKYENIKINLDNIKYIDDILKIKTKNIDNIIEKEFINRIKNKNFDNIIGLGLGLTPSGDDFFVGMFAAYIKLKNKIPKNLIYIVDSSKNKTNEISYNYLINAKNGLFKKEIIDVLDNLDKDIDIFKVFINKLLNFGSSSGRDVLLGIKEVIFQLC